MHQTFESLFNGLNFKKNDYFSSYQMLFIYTDQTLKLFIKTVVNYFKKLILYLFLKNQVSMYDLFSICKLIYYQYQI